MHAVKEATPLRSWLASLRKHSTYRRYIGGITWNTLASAISQGASFASSILTARLLGKLTFGAWGIAQSTIFTVTTTASAGMNASTAKLIAEYRNTDPAKAGRLILLYLRTAWVSGGICAVLLLFMAPWIAERLLRASELTDILRIGTGYVLFWSIWWSQIGVLNGLEAFRRIARINLLQAILTLGLTTLLTWLFGLKGAAVAMSVTAIMTYLLHRRAIRAECQARGIPMQAYVLSGDYGYLYKLTLPSAMSGWTTGAAIWACNAILAGDDGGLNEMAVFHASYLLRNLILFFPGLIAKVASSMLSNFVGASDYREYRRMLRSNLGLTAAAALLVGGLIALFAKPLLRAFGDGFADGSMTLVYLSLSAILETVALGLYQPLFAKGKWWSAFAVSAGWGAVLFGTFALFGQSLGAEGLALAYAAAWLFGTAAYSVAYHRLERRAAEH
jgi:O-antigen/teichoic acid export membrane protein